MNLDARRHYEKTLSCIFPCSITSLLLMNCRDKAEGMMQRFTSHAGHNVTDQPTSSESHPLAEYDFGPGYTEDIKSNLINGSKLVNHLFNIDGLRPIHVVSSEPTLHLCSQRSKHNTETSHSDPEQDSDMYYDFDLASTENISRSGCGSSGNLSSSYNIEKISYCRMEEDCELKGTESGCVTSVGSPILFNDSTNSTSNSQPSTDYSYIGGDKPSSAIDMNAVSNILTSSFQLTFKSFSDEDYNTKSDFLHIPHILKNRHKKERRRNRQSLQSKCSNCLNTDKHHSYLCHMRHSSINKYAKHDLKTDPKSHTGRDIKKRRIKNKSNCRKSRLDHVVKTSSSDSHESSETSPVNVLSSPFMKKYSKLYSKEDSFNEQIKQDDQYDYCDNADSLPLMNTQSQQKCQSSCDNDVIFPSHDWYYKLINSDKTSNVATKPPVSCFSKDVNSLDQYKVRSNNVGELKEADGWNSSHSNQRKKSFELQKAKHMEKTYKSLERKLPTKDMSYVNIEISDDASFKPRSSKSNKSHYTHDSKISTEESGEMVPLLACDKQTSNFSHEQVAANIFKRHADCANSQSKVACDNVRCAVSSYCHVYEEGTSSFKDYSSVVCDFRDNSLSDTTHYLHDSNGTLPLAMPKSEGQPKVKENMSKARTNGIIEDKLLKYSPENDKESEGHCPDSDLRITKIDEKCDNYINDVIGAVTSHSTEISDQNVSLRKESSSSVDCYNLDNNKNTDVNSSKPPEQEMDSSHVSVRPKTYFNRSRKSCKGHCSTSKSSKIDSQLGKQLDCFDDNCQNEESEINRPDSLLYDMDKSNILIDNNSSFTCENAFSNSSWSQADDSFLKNFENESSKYYDETSIEKSFNISEELDEIETLPEKDDDNDCDETELDDEDDIILTGKFKNVMNYEEKVVRVANKDVGLIDREIILLDDSDLPHTDDTKYSYGNQNEINESQLLSELTQLQLDDKQSLKALKVDVHLATTESPRSSCEREFSDGDDSKTRITRSSSLKCGKTPPGTPGRKKIVRFADVLGLDLADVRTFLEGVPDVPKSAFCDLKVEEEAAASLAGHGSTVAMAVSRRILTAMFQQPGSLPNFHDKVRYQKVSLENLTIGHDLSVRGIVRVYNIDFHKSVYVRYTFDHWRNHHETQASYVQGSSDGFSDRFSFLLWGSFLQCNGALIFCIRYCTNGQEFWDNNLNSNYVLQCYPSPPMSTACSGFVGRPQNDTNVQHNCKEKRDSAGHRIFMDAPSTPTDPWAKRFF